MTRQAQSFDIFDPHFLGWQKHEQAELGGIANALVGGRPVSSKTLRARAYRKLGMAGAYGLSHAQKAAVSKALNTINPDIVLAHFGWTAIAVAQALPKNLPLVLHVHGRDASALLTEPSYRAALQRVLPKLSGAIVVGQHQLDRLAPLGLPSNTDVIPCGAPLALFAQRPIPKQSSASSDKPVRFISVGRLSEEKGMRETLSAFEQVLKSVPDSELVLVGFGPLAAQLEQDIHEKGLGTKVRLTGRLTPEQIADELSMSHVYLQHSRTYQGWCEGFGVTLTEAGAAGLPLLASASGGLMDQIEFGENGFLFPESDVAAQADLMIKLAQDPELRLSLGTNARRLAGRFDSSLMANKLEQFLLQTLEGNAK